MMLSFLRQGRLREGLTLKQISQVTGISILKVLMIENGQKEASPRELALLCRALNIA